MESQAKDLEFHATMLMARIDDQKSAAAIATTCVNGALTTAVEAAAAPPRPSCDVAAQTDSAEELCRRCGEQLASPRAPPVPLQAALPPGWQEASDGLGRTYYYHEDTLEVSWELPGVETAEPTGELATASTPVACALATTAAACAEPSSGTQSSGTSEPIAPSAAVREGATAAVAQPSDGPSDGPSDEPWSWASAASPRRMVRTAQLMGRPPLPIIWPPLPHPPQAPDRRNGGRAEVNGGRALGGA